MSEREGKDRKSERCTENNNRQIKCIRTMVLSTWKYNSVLGLLGSGGESHKPTNFHIIVFRRIVWDIDWVKRLLNNCGLKFLLGWFIAGASTNEADERTGGKSGTNGESVRPTRLYNGCGIKKKRRGFFVWNAHTNDLLKLIRWAMMTQTVSFFSFNFNITFPMTNAGFFFLDYLDFRASFYVSFLPQNRVW